MVLELGSGRTGAHSLRKPDDCAMGHSTEGGAGQGSLMAGARQLNPPLPTFQIWDSTKVYSLGLVRTG